MLGDVLECYSNFNVYRNHLVILLNAGSGVRPKILHFWQFQDMPILLITTFIATEHPILHSIWSDTSALPLAEEVKQNDFTSCFTTSGITSTPHCTNLYSKLYRKIWIQPLPTSWSNIFLWLPRIVKMPLYSLHLWLPKTHVEAPTIGPHL